MKGLIMQKLQSIGWTFLICGLSGVLAQLLIVLYSTVSANNSIVLMLITMGFLGAIGATFGIYQKFEERALLGACLPFSGLASLVVNMYSGMRLEGVPFGAAFAKTSLTFFTVPVLGGIVAVLIGVAAHFLAIG